MNVGRAEEARRATAADPAATPGVDSSEACAVCGAPLSRSGPDGSCLRCALRLVFETDDEQETCAENGTGHGGPRRYGHFEVCAGYDGRPLELGSGAMATTYRARDTVLGTPVALKVIGAHVAGQAAARARFLREARAAARLHHPHVATVSFYGEEAGECFYAMELVEGETLAERVRRLGPLSAGQTLEIGVQVARALAAAEAVGVIHRDLKPGNLMLAHVAANRRVPGGAGPEDRREPAGEPLHVKVIDWGLAKAVSPAADPLLGAEHTREGGFVGTPAFASPEQFARATGDWRVDVRSDIYSLGATLWYLLCGKAPFVGDTLQSIHARQQTLPLEQLRVARVPGPLVETLKLMLAFDPAERPQSARELLDQLRRCQTLQGDHTSPSVRRWSLQAAGLCLLLLVGLAAAVATWRKHRLPPAVAEPALAVLPFKSLGPAADNGFFTYGMQDEITGDLSRAARMRVLSLDSTHAHPAGQARDYRRIGQQLAVGYLLEGSVERTDAGVRIAVRLIDTGHPEQAWEKTYQGRLDEVFGLQSQIAYAVAARLRVPLDAGERSGIERPLTTDPVAHDLYLRARAMEQEDTEASGDVQTHLDQVPLLEAAVARDPRFARAYCALSDVYLWLYNVRALTPAGAGTVDYRGLADVALAKARRLEPDGGEVHLATANILYTASHDNEQARIEADLARARLPNSRDVEFLTGEIAFGQGRWREAMRFLERAEALDPPNWRQRFDVAQYYRHLRQAEPFGRDMARVSADIRTDDAGYYRAAGSLGIVELAGDPAALTDAINALSPADDRDGRVRCIDGFMRGLFSRDADAAARALATYRADPLRQGTHLYPRAWYDALLARLRGDDAAAKAAFTAARKWMAGQAAANPDDGWMLGTLAVMDAGLGRREDAVREALRAVELTPYGRDLDYASCVRGNLALTYAWTDQPERALDVLETLADQPGSFDVPAQPSYGDLRLNPCWDPLRGRPRFEAVVRRFAQPVPGS